LTHERLRRAFQGQLQEGVEIVSVPGVIGGKARLLSGQVVPVIVPAVRGIFSWATQQIVRSLIGEPPEKRADREHYERRVAGLGNFLSRVYYDLRNLGITPEQRALNFAATNAFQASQVLESAATGTLELDAIDVRKSPVCRPDSDCYDIEIAFFDPTNVLVANRIYRFTVDVSDVMPVTIGAIRAWSRRPGAAALAHGV
jgi:cyanobactin maturation PatA/PatG family protease